MLIFLTTLLASLASIFRSRASLGLENLALRHQIGVLQKSAGKRPKLTSGDRLLWIFLSRLWRDWRSALAIVKPETVVAWHRAAFRLFWTWKVRCGRPSSFVLDLEGALRKAKLAQSRQVIGVDLQGHGRTELGDREFSLVNMGKDMAGVLK